MKKLDSVEQKTALPESRMGPDPPSRELLIDRYAQWAELLNVRRVGLESSKSYLQKSANGFFRQYVNGPNILDIGYRGKSGSRVPIVEGAIGVDMDYPDYDGLALPFADESQNCVYSSHCLEHISNWKDTLREWHRVTKIGGFIVIVVPHQHLYEKKAAPPSSWSDGHLRFYTPARLLWEIEESLKPNTYRVRHLADNDFLHNYDLPPDVHSNWCYEIDLVLERLPEPEWKLR